jgi:hypothetical protein
VIYECAHAHGPNTVHAVIVRANGAIEDLGVSTNLRTTAGIDWQADVMGHSTQPSEAQWIALTTDTATPAAGDTTLAGEITTGGLDRAQGAYTHTSGVASYKITKTFTATAIHTDIHKVGLFTASSSGIMPFESVLSSNGDLEEDDTITIEWTVLI